jgi:hypothetical protein
MHVDPIVVAPVVAVAGLGHLVLETVPAYDLRQNVHDFYPHV